MIKTIIMSIKTLIGKIGSFFTNLFASAAKTWKNVSPEVQNALLHGTGVIAVINDNLDKTPAFVIDFILSKFPVLTVDKLHEVLKKSAEGLSIAESVNSDDLEATIKALQTYLGSLKGQVWAKISHTLSLGIAVALAPAGTKMAAIISLIEFVYHSFIKGK